MKKGEPVLKEESEYFRSRIRGNFCEQCGKNFEEGEIIFTPEQVSLKGETITRYFCGAKFQCLEVYKNKHRD